MCRPRNLPVDVDFDVDVDVDVDFDGNVNVDVGLFELLGIDADDCEARAIAGTAAKHAANITQDSRRICACSLFRFENDERNEPSGKFRLRPSAVIWRTSVSRATVTTWPRTLPDEVTANTTVRSSSTWKIRRANAGGSTPASACGSAHRGSLLGACGADSIAGAR